ncbi:MAG: SPOR domain-containing protein, partial [Betaproteobacteria bacterium]|nr:SPOR domain-containing protein [Betaproteobacteria bacterium]
MTEPQDVDALRRRGRRRLVGAIALVLLAIIVLPMVFEQRPRETAPVSVRIPSENEGGPAPQAQADAAPGAAPSPAPTPAPAPAGAPA